MNNGVKFFNTKEYPNSIDCFRRAEKLNPDVADANFYATLGQAYYKVGNRELAIKCLTSAVKLCPEEESLYFNRGVAYFEIKEYELSIKDFTRCTELNPDNAMPFNNRGAAYKRLNEYSRAKRDYERALKLDPEGRPAT